MTPAEKVVAALREIADPRAEAVVGKDVMAALADFVLAAMSVRNPPQTCGARDHSCANCDIDKKALDSALARLAAVLTGGKP